MFFHSFFLLYPLLLVVSVDASSSSGGNLFARADAVAELKFERAPRNLKSTSTKKSKPQKSSKSSSKTPTTRIELSLAVTNPTRNQPFGEFFVMVHNKKAPLLYTLGNAASAELTALAQDGNPSELVSFYNESAGVFLAKSVTPPGGTVVPGSTFTINVTITKEFHLVTIASMALNSNDAFVAINGKKLLPGTAGSYNGLDAGTEENDEICVNIPGPVCSDGGNENPGNGEGYVQVHSGVRLGLSLPTGITVAGEDWRNPMMSVSVSKA